MFAFCMKKQGFRKCLCGRKTRNKLVEGIRKLNAQDFTKNH